MKIRSMFAKDINRDINGVIKIDQNDEQVMEQELSEYVVTRELRSHFSTFYDAYERAIDEPTDKMGVWISGFFGSGKSHFLKMLSYLLTNREVAGKTALDYFRAECKKAGFAGLHLMSLGAENRKVPIAGNDKPAPKEVSKYYGYDSMSTYNWTGVRNGDYITWRTTAMARWDTFKKEAGTFFPDEFGTAPFRIRFCQGMRATLFKQLGKKDAAAATGQPGLF